jgi:PEP-CTERM motif
MTIAHRIAALAGALTLCAASAQAAVTYNFSVDTSSLAGTNGFIELQFANGGGGAVVAQEATATISGFTSTGGVLSSENPYTSSDLFSQPNVFGSVSGTLPGAVVMDQITTNFDDYLHAFQFGSDFSFDLTLSGPAIDAPACVGASSCSLPGFAFDLLNADGSQFLLSNFILGQVEVNPDGSTTATAFTTIDTPSAVTITPVTTAAGGVPEPTAWSLMLLGFGGVGGLIRQRRRTPAFS